MTAKISGLTVDNTPLETDILEYTTDPGGTPLTRSTTVSGLLAAGDAYGTISRNATGGSQTISTAYQKIDQFDTNGVSSNTTPDQANDKITVDVTGIYEVAFGCSHTGANNTVYTIAIHVDGVEQANIRTQRKLGTGADVGSSARTGILSLTAAEEVDLRVKADSGTPAFDVESIGLFVHRIG